MANAAIKAAVAAAAVLSAVFAEAKTALYTEYITGWDDTFEGAAWKGPTVRGNPAGITFERDGADTAANWKFSFKARPNGEETTITRYALNQQVSQPTLPQSYTRHAGTAADKVPETRYLYGTSHDKGQGVIMPLTGVFTSAQLEAAVLAKGLDSSVPGVIAYAAQQRCRLDWEYVITFIDPAHAGHDAYAQTITNSAALAVNRFRCDGCTFKGWALTAGGSVEYGDGAAVAPSDDLTLYAVWEPISYTIQFNGGEGSSGSQSNISAKYHEVKRLPGCNYSKTGHQFLGWDLNPNATVPRWQEGSQVSDLTTESDGWVTMYAIWEARTYEVYFDGNEGTPSASKIFVRQGAPYGELPTASRPDKSEGGYTKRYRFIGWFTSRSAGSLIEETSIFVNGANQTLYAHWEETAVANTYTVTFDPQRGEVMPTSKSVTYAQSYGELPVPTRLGYQFAGWYSAPSGGYQILPTSTVQITADTTVFAHWTPIEYTIKFNPGIGGEGSQNNLTAKYDEPVTLPLCYYQRKGFKALGWDPSETAIVPKYREHEVVSNLLASAGVFELYAIWTNRSYTVHFDGNGGTAEVAKKEVWQNEPYGELPSASCPSEVIGGYTYSYSFNGWFTARSGGAQVKPSTVFTEGDDQYLYAQWEEHKTANVYTLTFDARGGEVSPSSVKVTYAGQYEDLPVPDRTGYAFDGWFTAALGGVRIADGDEVRITADTTVFAHWTAKQYDVNLSAVGAESPGKTKVRATFDELLPTLTMTDLPEKTGLKFAGYYLIDGEVRVRYYDQDGLPTAKWQIDGSATLTALWQDDPNFELTLEANGGCFDGDIELVSKKVPCVDGEAYPELPTPVNSGKVFAGWWTAADYTAGGQKATGEPASLGVKQLFARWKTRTKDDDCTVYFKSLDGGGVEFPSKMIARGSAVGTLPTVDYADTGRRLFGWFRSPDGGERVSEDTEFYDEVTLYAIYTETKFNVALGNEGLAFQNSRTAGEYGWEVEDNPAYQYDGRPTLRSEEMPGGDDFYARIRVYSPAAGELSFHYRTEFHEDEDGEMWSDKLMWKSDNGYGSSTYRNSSDWATQVESVIQNGWSEFSYLKKPIGFEPVRRAWISELVFTPESHPSPIAGWDVIERGSPLEFETGGGVDGGWRVSDATGDYPDDYNGIVATGKTDNAAIWVRTTATGRGTLSFRWKANCEAGYYDGVLKEQVWCDRMEFLCDGEVIARLDGLNKAFVRYDYQVAAGGEHVFTWRYVKDASGAAGKDTGYLDAVVWTPAGKPEPTEEDAPKVTAFDFAAGVFTLTCGNASDDFEYVLERTRSILPAEWEDVVTNSAAGTVVFDDLVVGDEQSMFYRVRVQSKAE